MLLVVSFSVSTYQGQSMPCSFVCHEHDGGNDGNDDGGARHELRLDLAVQFDQS